MSKVLIVEDNQAMETALRDGFQYEGFEVIVARDGEEGLRLATEGGPDLIILDVMLPKMNGLDVCKKIRSDGNSVPIIILTARGQEIDKVLGLKLGADDYVTKPFSALELLARVEAVLRRSPERPNDIQHLQINGRRIDLERREVSLANGEVRHLSEREAAILRYLAACRDRAIDRDELLHRVWGLNPRGIETRTVDMQIARLREKLAVAGDESQVILTVRGKGYMLADAVQASAPAP